MVVICKVKSWSWIDHFCCNQVTTSTVVVFQGGLVRHFARFSKLLLLRVVAVDAGAVLGATVVPLIEVQILGASDIMKMRRMPPSSREDVAEESSAC